MSDGYAVDVDQIRRHAARLDALHTRLASVQSASTHITRDARAYGTLCQWISQVLAARHTKQHQLVAQVAENLALSATSLRETAEVYTANDDSAADTLSKISAELGRINQALENIGRGVR
ncbi:type VII secretion target [Actinokineospora cianjurensis]|uniref:Excreted virulence factor EspC (Type VII ESX diderm) n=1 Tax=Actinokineospora cianjurensis TaxID=585224 RepID=A0A421B167_9PSEU|nr:type VII secretion target [Actinokineospora cianjurensis]RLK58159.1 excreted virulence factor EspC (type VII ESX diderm) [Actinokineospora cianjurensis]